MEHLKEKIRELRKRKGLVPLVLPGENSVDFSGRQRLITIKTLNIKECWAQYIAKAESGYNRQRLN